MLAFLSNIYLLSFLVALVGTLLTYAYIRMTNKTDEYTNSYYFKSLTLYFITALSASWCREKLSSTHTIASGGGATITPLTNNGTNTTPDLLNEPVSFNMEKFNTGRPTF